MNRLSLSLFFSVLMFVGQVSAQLSDEPVGRGHSEADMAPKIRSVTLIENQDSTDSDHKNYLPAELSPFIQQGLVSLAAVRPSQSSLKELHKEPTAIIGDDGAIELKDGVPQPLGFGSADVLLLEPEDKALAPKILWNLSARASSAPITEYKFSMSSQELSHSGEARLLQGTATYIYPALLFPDTVRGQLFRERFTFSQPAFLSTLSWLSFRFFGGDEDFVWYYSPAIHKTRQLAGLSRSRSLVPRFPAAEDIFVWSGKLEDFSARVESTEEYAVPVLRQHRLSTSEQCVSMTQVARNHSEGAGRVVDSTASGPVGMFPPDVEFELRSLWKLVLRSKNPYTASGREVLYVDTATMAPVYRFSYSKSGSLQKVLVGGHDRIDLAFASEQPAVVSTFTTLLRVPENWVASVQFKEIVLCEVPGENQSLTFFDPSRIAPPSVEETTSTE